jgi:hypothetical protein
MPSPMFGRATQLHAAMLTFAVLAAMSAVRARAEEPPLPQVVSAAPKDCKDLGEVSGKVPGSFGKEEKGQVQAVKDARDLGATHLVVTDVASCSPYDICYEGKAYRCPSAAPASPGK